MATSDELLSQLKDHMASVEARVAAAYAQGVQDTVARLHTMLDQEWPTTPRDVPSGLTRGQAKSFEYLRQHPGATAWQAGKPYGNRFYELEKLGHARRNGPRFYLVETTVNTAEDLQC